MYKKDERHFLIEHTYHFCNISIINILVHIERSYEWRKHGSCAYSVAEVNTILKYFKKVLQLAEQYNVTGKLFIWLYLLICKTLYLIRKVFEKSQIQFYDTNIFLNKATASAYITNFLGYKDIFLFLLIVSFRRKK